MSFDGRRRGRRVVWVESDATLTLSLMDHDYDSRAARVNP